MPTLKVAYSAATKTIRVLNNGDAIPGGFVNMGTFAHPDATYPDSVVIYHGIRDLLNTRSAVDPSQPALFPDNIMNMQEIQIEMLALPGVIWVQNLPVATQYHKKTTEDLTLEVLASAGTDAVSYMWQLDGVNIDFNPSAITKSLQLTNLSSLKAGTYRCIASGSGGINTAISNSVEVFVTGVDPVILPEITEDLPDTDTYTANVAKQLSITATGTGEVMYEWFHNGVGLAIDSEHSGVYTDTLTLTSPTSPAQDGDYYCEVTDEFGTVTSNTCTLSVAP